MIKKHVMIIAEAGVNHNGSLELAKKLIDEAAWAGADVVKFQTFKAERLVSRFAEKAAYQKQTTDANETQFEMIKRLELDPHSYSDLISYCDSKNIKFLATPFDEESADFLVQIGVAIIKIPSGEINNLPYLRHIGKLCKPILLSTGMANLGEIETALSVLTENGSDDITVLHCNTEYPTPIEDVNLNAMLTIREAFKVKIGYSDHTLGIEIPIAAAAIGAAVIEKHFTLDRTMDGPDHRASLEPDDLKEMVKCIRNIEIALGAGIKAPSPSEIKNRPIVRKSIVAARPINQGEILTSANLAVKRPGDGISPMRWDEVIGLKAKRSFKLDELIEI